MFAKLRTITLAAVIAVSAPVAALAAQITGQIEITGSINVPASDFSATGQVVMDPSQAFFGAISTATGSFTGLAGSYATLFDIDFTAPSTIWTAGAFSFAATSFGNFSDTLTKSFKAYGTISAAGFTDTLGLLTFTSQLNNPNQVTASFSSTTTPVPVPAAGFLLVGGLAGLAALRRRKKAA